MEILEASRSSGAMKLAQVLSEHRDALRDAAWEVVRYRNWYWSHGREARGDPGVTLSTVTTAYPSKADPISDVANSDAGGNFGRIARVGQPIAAPLADDATVCEP